MSAISSEMASFAAVVREGMRFAFWNTKPIWPRRNPPSRSRSTAGFETSSPRDVDLATAGRLEQAANQKQRALA